jgi:hypothetical protein
MTNASVAEVVVWEGIVAPSVEGEVVVESVVGAFTDEVVESALTVVEVGDVTAAEVGVEETAVIVCEAPVPTGTLFWRYCRGRRASSILMPDARMAKRRSSTYDEAPGRNMLTSRFASRKEKWLFSKVVSRQTAMSDTKQRAAEDDCDETRILNQSTFKL